MLAYCFAKTLSFIFCLLPASFCERLGHTLGALTWNVVPKKRRTMAAENVRRCLGVNGKEAERIARESWVAFGPMVMEILRFPKLKNHFEEFVEIEGMELLKDGLALGRGAVIATAHCGNWELLGGALARAGCPLVGVAMRQRDAGFDRFINEYRRMVGMHVTYKDNVREMFDLLKEGRAIGLLMDQDSSIRDGIIFDWFGQPTNFVQGPAAIARFRSAPIFPTYITRLSGGHHKIIVHPPIFVEKTKDKAADIRRTMMALGEILEAHIRRHSEEWFWLHDRWKSVRSRQESY